jgi:hypothetical protein
MSLVEVDHPTLWKKGQSGNPSGAVRRAHRRPGPARRLVGPGKAEGMSERALRAEPALTVECLSCRHVGVLTDAALLRRAILRARRSSVS